MRVFEYIITASLIILMDMFLAWFAARVLTRSMSRASTRRKPIAKISKNTTNLYGITVIGLLLPYLLFKNPHAKFYHFADM